MSLRKYVIKLIHIDYFNTSTIHQILNLNKTFDFFLSVYTRLNYTFFRIWYDIIIIPTHIETTWEILNSLVTIVWEIPQISFAFKA